MADRADDVPAVAFDHGLFGRLRRDTPQWSGFVRHPFLAALADGTLPTASFRNFLIQDYLYLIQYARAYALSAYKSEDLADIRAAGRTMQAVLDVEMPLHIAYCAQWGLSETEMAETPPDPRMQAYAWFFLERGAAGDKLDLDVALAPCIVGYAELAERLLAEPATVLEGNPYGEWIKAYASPEYREVAQNAIEALETLGRRKGADARYPSLIKTFRTATALETEFWAIGWP